MEFVWTRTSPRFNLGLFVCLLVCLSNSMLLQISYFKALRNLSKNLGISQGSCIFWACLTQLKLSFPVGHGLPSTPLVVDTADVVLPPAERAHQRTGRRRSKPGLNSCLKGRIYTLYNIYIYIHIHCVSIYMYIHIYYTYMYYTFFVMYTSCNMVCIYIICICICYIINRYQTKNGDSPDDLDMKP